jgi:hypothetical protein
MGVRVTRTYDDKLILNEYGTAITSSAAGSDTANTALIVDLAAGTAGSDTSGLVEGDIIVDVLTMDVDSGNEMVTIGVQLSNSATFASSYYQVSSLAVGDAAALVGDVDMTTGRYVIPFNNLIKDGTTLRYLRLYFTVAGTVSGFKCLAYLALRGRQ